MRQPGSEKSPRTIAPDVPTQPSPMRVPFSTVALLAIQNVIADLYRFCCRVRRDTTASEERLVVIQEMTVPRDAAVIADFEFREDHQPGPRREAASVIDRDHSARANLSTIAVSNRDDPPSIRSRPATPMKALQRLVRLPP
jgi:hypothetical protein